MAQSRIHPQMLNLQKAIVIHIESIIATLAIVDHEFAVGVAKGDHMVWIDL